MNRKVREFNTLLESLNLVDPPLNRPSCLEGEVGFDELFKEYEIGDVSEEEIVGDELGVEYFDKFPTRDELGYHNQVKENKIDLLVQQYEKLMIPEDESIDNAFARAKVTAVEESKDLTSLSLNKLIGNLKVHEVIIKKDSEIVKGKGERKSLALKDKNESSDEESLTSKSDDKEYAMAVRDFNRFFKRRGRCRDPNHLIGECPKPPRDKNQRAFVGGSWTNSGEEDEEKTKYKTFLMAQTSNEKAQETAPRSFETASELPSLRNPKKILRVDDIE
ncbi:hypothetical protein Tco_0450786 [Tanacetum coccineum]